MTILEPRPDLSIVALYELGLYTPQTPDQLYAILRERQAQVSLQLGQVSLQQVTEV